MIIFNGKEMSSKFVRNNKIVEINSTIKNVPEAIEKMRELIKNGDQESLNNFFYVSSYKYADQPFEFIKKGTPEWNGTRNIFDEILSQTELEVYTDAAAVYERPDEFKQYERFQFNLSTAYNFEPIEVGFEEVLQELMVGFGILPTLLEEDKSVEELKTLSKSGESLVRMFKGEDYAISKFNAPPPLNWIEAYQALTPYEKRIISDGRIHPAKAMQISKGLKDFAKDMLIRQEMIDFIIENHANTDKNIPSKEVISFYTEEYAKAHPELIRLSEEVFKEKFRGHAPRVLSEYMEGALAARGISEDQCTREIIEQIADQFSQTNVSRVAKYRNPLLLALSEKVTMGNMKDNVLQAIGVSVPTKTAKELFAKGFPEWLNAHADVKPEEVLKICSLIHQMGSIDVNESAKELIAKVELKKGYEDAKRFEKKSIYASQGYKFADNEIAIKGRNIVCKQGNLTMRMLKADDYKNFLVGIETHCCQRYGDAGESCVYKYTSDPFAACVVIERGNKIVAQGFVWTDEANDTFVFDNVELDNDRDVQQFSDLFAAYAKALPYANVHVGTGYNQGMNGWGMKVGQDKKNLIFAVMPTTLDGRMNITSWGNGNCYSDYHTTNGSVARVIKHVGTMKLEQKNAVEVISKPDEPTKWDVLATPDFNFMLNEWTKTPEQRIAMCNQFKQNPSEALQMDFVKTNPQAVLSLDNVCYNAQIYIKENYPHLLSKIKNPCEEVVLEMVKCDPSYISMLENPPENVILEALAHDGNLISMIENPSEEECLTAVYQNEYAIKSISPEKQTANVQLAAIRKNPQMLLVINNPCEEAIEAAIELRPEIVASLRDIPPELQTLAVNIKPSVINMINDPAPSAVSRAVHLNGLLIRNFQKQYPELRNVALRQNGFAIQCLHNVTLEEARLAIEQNSNAVMAIKDKDMVEQILNRNTAEPNPVVQNNEIEFYL